MKRRILAWIMAFMIIFGTMPNNIWTASAATEEGTAASGDPLYKVTNPEPQIEDGIYLNKQLSLGNDGSGEITLETYVTGNVSTKAVPTDIILVLDQSGSMDEDDMTLPAGYYETSGTPEELYENRNNLYVKTGEDTYARVTVEANGSSEDVYTQYNNGNNSSYYNSSNQGNLYHRCSNGVYSKLTVNRTGNYYSGYTFIYNCEKCGEITRDSGSGYNDRPSSTYRNNFYLKETTTTVNSYTFTYTKADGTTETVTVNADDNAPDWDFYTYEQAGTISRLQALKNAANAFADSVAEQAKGEDGVLGSEDDVDHTISIVGFANSSSYDNYNNTEVFVGGDSI